MKRKKKCAKLKLQTHFHQKVGSHLKEVDLSSRDWSENDTLIYYVIVREEIEACDTSRLLHDLRPEPANPFLMAGPGAVLFSVSGYDEDARELLEIHDVRSFFRKVQETAPCWLYFAIPGAGWLRFIMSASNPNCRFVRKSGQSRIITSLEQIAEFIVPQIKEYDRLCEMMGIDQDVSGCHLLTSSKDSFPGFPPSSKMG